MTRPALPVERLREAEAAGQWKATEAGLRARLAEAPSDRTALEALGGLYRRLGRLAEAAGVYDRLHAVAPDHFAAAFLAAVFRGEPPPPGPADGLRPAPFVRVSGVLTPPERERLLALARERAAAFEPLEVVRGGPGGYTYTVEPAERQQMGLLGQREVEALLRPRFLHHLHDAFARLELAPFTPGEVNIQLALTHDGHFSKAHVDDGGGRFRVSAVYYFHRHPKPFTGGDLLLFDTHRSARRYHPLAFTRLAPEDNTLVFFPCEYFHEVTRVHCPSPAFEDGRFAVAAHIGVR